MSERCPDCGGELPPAPEDCPVCAELPVDPHVPAGGAPELGQYAALGWKPGNAMDSVRPAVADGEVVPEREVPPSPADGSSALAFRRLVIRAGIVCAVALVGLLLVARLGGGGSVLPDELSANPPRWSGRGVAESLARLRHLVPDAIPVPEDDAEPEPVGLDTQEPESPRAARDAHEPLPLDTDVAHAVHSIAVDRLCRLEPRWAIALGEHPHPRGLAMPDDAHVAALRAVWSDVLAWCEAHPVEQAGTAHERHDRWVLWGAARGKAGAFDDDVRLGGVRSLLSTLRTLDVVRCCARADRGPALAGCLDDVPEYVRVMLGSLQAPGPDDCRATAATLRHEAYLLGTEIYGDTSRDAYLRATAERAAKALLEAADRLDDWPAAAPASGAAPTPPDVAAPPDGAARKAQYFAWLCDQLGGGLTPRDHFDAAVQEMRDADAELGRLWHASFAAPRNRRVTRPADRIERLGKGTVAWVGAVADDPGVAFVSVRAASTDWSGLLYAPGPRAPPTPSAFVSDWPDLSLRGQDAEHQDRVRQHLAAHETYPGHHLQHLLSREACELRGELGSPFLEEGWAVYAEDLIHETRDCHDGAMDRWVRAYGRLEVAWAAALEMLHACGEHTVDELAAIQDRGGDTADPEWVASRVAPGASTQYLLGRRAIERLRRRAEAEEGAAFDRTAFHRRLLSLGALPPRLLEEEMFGD